MKTKEKIKICKCGYGELLKFSKLTSARKYSPGHSPHGHYDKLKQNSKHMRNLAATKQGTRPEQCAHCQGLSLMEDVIVEDTVAHFWRCLNCGWRGF